MMMWYKAFSLHVLLRMGFHVLFQDVDLVWFKDPFPHLHRNMQNDRGEFEYEAYLSDDGARAIRYSPFFANSGFYYLRSTESTRSFSYSVMLGFDILHATGSHQNVFTFRLLENMVRILLLNVLLSMLFSDLSFLLTGVVSQHQKEVFEFARLPVWCKVPSRQAVHAEDSQGRGPSFHLPHVLDWCVLVCNCSSAFCPDVLYYLRCSQQTAKTRKFCKGENVVSSASV